jgi:hypothetical protein
VLLQNVLLKLPVVLLVVTPNVRLCRAGMLTARGVGGQSGTAIEIGSYLAPQRGCKRVEWAVVVGLAEQGAQGQESRAHIVDCGPLVLQDIEADVPVHIDIGVEARRDELDGWR